MSFLTGITNHHWQGMYEGVVDMFYQENFSSAMTGIETMHRSDTFDSVLFSGKDDKLNSTMFGIKSKCQHPQFATFN